MSRLSFLGRRRGPRTAPRPPWLAIAGGALMVISGLLSWSYDDRILGNIAVRFYPAGIQIYAMMFGVLAVILGVLLLRRPAVDEPGPRPAHPRHHRPGVPGLGARLDRRTRPVA